MNPVFLDTVGLLALWDQSDQWHDPAELAFQALLKNRLRLVTTPQILLECGNAAARRPYRNEVNKLRLALIASGGLIEPTPEEFEKAWAAYDRGEAGNAGIVDQISFLIMHRLGIPMAFTNDGHFRAAGFVSLF